MSRQSTKHSGDKSSPAQQRKNRAMSAAALFRLLQLNFSEGARLIVLTYDLSGYVPSWAYAQPDRLHRIRKAAGGAFTYVRIIERQLSPQPAIVHRVVISLRREDAQQFAEQWKHGPAWAEEITVGQFPALVEQVFKNEKGGGCFRCWSPSKGLKRPQL